MTNLYHRELLPKCPTEHLEGLLDEALAWIAGQSGKLSMPVMEALQTRLYFRKSFLQSLNADYEVNHKKKDNPPWGSCANFLPALLSSHNVGIRVSEAFSIKIQRRLASTVPPRPIVNISFKDTYDYLSKLSKDGQDVQSILKCQNGREIQVSFPSPWDQVRILVLPKSDFRTVVQCKRKPAISIYQMPSSNAHSRRDEGAWPHCYQAIHIQ